MAKISVNFTGVNDNPQGELLLQVEKVTLKDSNAGNPMIMLQCVIVNADDDRWIGRKVFPGLLLETDMKRQTFQALEALGLNVPEGNFDFDADELVGKTCWVFAKDSARKDGQGNMTQISKWGIEPEHAKASIS